MNEVKWEKLISLINEHRWAEAYELTFEVENEVETELLTTYGEPNRVSEKFELLRMYLLKRVRDDIKARECRRLISEILRLTTPFGIGNVAGAESNGIRIDVVLESLLDKLDRDLIAIQHVLLLPSGLSTVEAMKMKIDAITRVRNTLNAIRKAVDSIVTDRTEVIEVIEKLVRPSINDAIAESLVFLTKDPKAAGKLAESISEVKEAVMKLVVMLRHPERSMIVADSIRDVFSVDISSKVSREAVEAAVEKQRSGGAAAMPGKFDWVDEDWELVLQHPRIYVIIGHRGSGKCLAKGTLVVTEDGSLVEINKLEGGKVAGLDLNDYKIKVCRNSPVMYSGRKKVYRVVFDTGREILATDNHPFLTIEGWKQLKELKVGDRVATPRRIEVFGNEDLDENLVKVTAYLLGDGRISGKLEFVNRNPVIAEDFKNAVEALGLRVVERVKDHYDIVAKEKYIKKYPDPEKDGTDIVELYKKGYSINQIAKALNKHYWYVWNKLKDAGVLRSSREGLHMVIGNHLVRLLREWGLYGSNAETKFIPDPIFRLPREKLRVFLSRLFACDGSVYSNSRGRGYVVEYMSKSKKLVQQVQHLLLRFGIISFIKEKVVNGNTYYRLVIYGKDAKRFVEEIGIFGKPLPNVEVPENHNPNKDTLPKEIWKIVRSEMKRRGFSNLKLARALGVDKRYITNWKHYEPSRDKIMRIAEALDSDLLRKLCSEDVYWDRIVKIEEVGVMDVYDIETEFTNFIANDIIVHNSASAHAITEFLKFKHNVKAYFMNVVDRPIPPKKLALLPNWMEVVNDLDEVSNNSIVLVDEAYIKFHARTSMREAYSRAEMDKILELSRQKVMSLIFVTQSTTKIDKNIIEATDTFIIKSIHHTRVKHERPSIKSILEEAYEAFKSVPKSSKVKYAYVFSDTDGFAGLKTIGLPSYWNEELSRFYEGF